MILNKHTGTKATIFGWNLNCL